MGGGCVCGGWGLFTGVGAGGGYLVPGQVDYRCCESCGGSGLVAPYRGRGGGPEGPGFGLAGGFCVVRWKLLCW